MSRFEVPSDNESGHGDITRLETLQEGSNEINVPVGSSVMATETVSKSTAVQQDTRQAVDIDFLASMVADLDAEYLGSVSRSSTPSPSPVLHVSDILPDLQDDWAVIDSSSLAVRPSAHAGPSSQGSKFNFAQKQDNAVQVDFDSQDEPGTRVSTPRHSASGHAHRSNHTPMTPRAKTADQTASSDQATPRPVNYPTEKMTARVEPAEDEGDPDQIRFEIDDDILPSASQLDPGNRAENLKMMRLGTDESTKDSLSAEEDDMLPSASQFLHTSGVEIDVESDEYADLVPNETQLNAFAPTQLNAFAPTQKQSEREAFAFSHGNPDSSLMPTLHYDEKDLVPDIDMLNDVEETGTSCAESRQLAASIQPTAQHRLHYGRVAKRGDALEFGNLNSDEDEEDRQLLHSAPLVPDFFDGDPGNGDLDMLAEEDPIDEMGRQQSTNALRLFHSRVTPSVVVHRRDPSKLNGRRRSPSPRPVQASNLQLRSGHRPRLQQPALDPFMEDEDGSLLEEDLSLVIPQDFTSRRSRIHGRLNGHVSAYSRLSGRMRWTKDQELLLYRTVQKVPLSEGYPLKLMWNLHGEHGLISRELEQFNPQHMKDKMRTIVETRVRNNRAVVGRARWWLPTGHPDKLAFEKEMKAYIKWLQNAHLSEDEDEGREDHGEEVHERHGNETDDEVAESEEVDNREEELEAIVTDPDDDVVGRNNAENELEEGEDELESPPKRRTRSAKQGVTPQKKAKTATSRPVSSSLL